jgi:hypothetical protein
MLLMCCSKPHRSKRRLLAAEHGKQGGIPLFDEHFAPLTTHESRETTDYWNLGKI